MESQFICVKCIVCGKLHLLESETYFRFVGNVYIGIQGGIIGDNFPQSRNEDGSPNYLQNGTAEIAFKKDEVQTTIVCRTLSCIRKALPLMEVTD